MPFDRAKLYFTEVALYQEYEPEDENRILPLILLLCKQMRKIMAKL